MATSVLKKITAEAKLLRKQNPKLKWTTAIKKASEFYKGTVKPVAKKTYKKAKAVAKAGAKGVAVARRSYAKSMAGKSKVGATRSNNKKTTNTDYTIFLGEITSSAGNKWKVYQKDITPRKGSYITYDWRIVRAKDSLLLPNVNLPEEVSLYHFNKNKNYITNLIDKKEATIGGVKKIAFKRTGKGSSKLGSVKKDMGIKLTKQVKPIKPTIKTINEQNHNFISNYKFDKKLIVYSPKLNRYLLVAQDKHYQDKDKFIVYLVSPAQKIEDYQVFYINGNVKGTLGRINKKFDIDLIP